MASLTDSAARRQAEYLARTTSAYRKGRGQVFTPPDIARFMAGLLQRMPSRFRLLDPGAGAGLLSVAVCERLLRRFSPRQLYIHAFEPEQALAAILRANLEQCKRALSEAGHDLSFTVDQNDFIAVASAHLEEPGLFKPAIADDFDAAVMNPPYCKLRKDSRQARLMERVVHGQPNAYAFFLTLGARLLKPGGELVAITPRSFCNGLYFRGFRRWFFDRMSLERLHLFESRTEAFKESDVLQESVITKARKLGMPSQEVRISSSLGKSIPSELPCSSLPYPSIVDDSCGQRLVKIPVSDLDCRVMRALETLPRRFEDTGLRISTGPVVTFRATDLILHEQNGQSVVPLLMSHNVKPYRTEWPIARKRHPLYMIDNERSRGRKLLLPTRNCVILKRFSAKEEKRRLTAACLLRREQHAPCIGLENHLNYIHLAYRELTEHEVFGVAALLNSMLLDRYFRILSGNTQVNATDIRNVPFPSLEVLGRVGKAARAVYLERPEAIEPIIAGALGITNSLVEDLAPTSRREGDGRIRNSPSCASGT
jgi:adenine-specific DNA-methyltransferase